MHFDIAEAETHHLCNAVEQIAPVLLLRIEKTVLRALAGSVGGSVAGDSRQLVSPPRHSAKRDFDRCALTQRFEMIGDGDPGALWLREPQILPQAVPQIRRKPNLRVSRELHRMDLLIASLVRLSQMRSC